MNSSVTSKADTNSRTDPGTSTSSASLVIIGVMAWLGLLLGFVGLRMLLQERPQFIGRPLQHSQGRLVQESPRVHLRKATDDVSVVQSVHPAFSDVHFDLRGHRDYRGLKTLVDMAGTFRARHTLTNPYSEALFVLFQTPHPRSSGDGELQAADLRLQSSATGILENGKESWRWSGRIEPHQSVLLDVSYEAASIRQLEYRIVPLAGAPVGQFRFQIQRTNLESMRFDTGDGTLPGADGNLVWDRRNFLAPVTFSAAIVEGRSLHESLLQLLEIGPIVCLLFMLTSGAMLLARHAVSPAQLLTLLAGYALYFPLVLYLSSRFSFAVALILSLLVPGALLVNYIRLQFGGTAGWIATPIGLLLYQLFPTLAAFAGWNRGMVLLCLGVITFGVLIQLQNAALKRPIPVSVAVASAFALLLANPLPVRSAEVQRFLPTTLRLTQGESVEAKSEGLIAFDPAVYRIQDWTNYLRVEVTVAFEVVQEGQTPMPLFVHPVHVNSRRLDPALPEGTALITQSNRWGLLAGARGRRTLTFDYQVPLEIRDNHLEATVPLLVQGSGRILLTTPRSGIHVTSGALWQELNVAGVQRYELGVSGEDQLKLRFDAASEDNFAGKKSGARSQAGEALYGIGISQAHHLTVVASDGSCTHFSELEFPASKSGEFLQRLPTGSRLVSASLNGIEIPAPTVISNTCRILLPAESASSELRRLSLRIALPRVELGFLGDLELELPEADQTIGTLHWVITLPSSFDVQVVSSGLDVQKTAPDLARFGEYGRVLKSNPGIHLEKVLAPTGQFRANLRYRQSIVGNP